MLNEEAIQKLIQDKEMFMNNKSDEIARLQKTANEIDTKLKDNVNMYNATIIEINQLREVLGGNGQVPEDTKADNVTHKTGK